MRDDSRIHGIEHREDRCMAPGFCSTARKKLLLIEDELIIAAGESRMLQRSGYEVMTAASGEEALDMIKAGLSIDLALMDIDLGDGMDGTEAAKQILALRNIPIVFLTSHAERDMVEKVRGITRYGYVIKNSGDFVLLSSIEMAFDLFEAHRNAAQKNMVLTETNRKMQEIEERFNQLSEHGRAFAWEVNTDGLYTYVNSACESLLGYKPEEIIGRKHFYDLHPEEGREAFKNAAFEVFKSNEPFRDLPNPVQCSDGQVLWVTTNGIPVFESNGTLAGYRGTDTDVSGRRLADERLRDNEKHLLLIYDTVNDVIFHLAVEPDETYRFISINSTFLAVTGLTREQVIGRMVHEVIPEPSLAMVLGKYREAIRQRAPVHWEETSRYPTGLVTGKVTVVPVFNDRGQCTHLVGSVHDITEQRRKLEKLEWHEEIFNQFMAHSPVLVYIKDENLRLINISRNFEELLGKPLAELVGKDSFELLPPEFARQAIADDLKTLNESVIVNREEELGGRVYTTIKFPIKRDEGKPDYLGGFSVDITERKQMEKKILELLAEKELLLKEVHHRIKNHMSTMLSLLMLQVKKAEDPKVAQSLAEARSQLQSMELLYDRLYRSEDFRKVSLKAYLPHLIAEIVSIFPKREQVTIEADIAEFSLSPNIVPPLGLIVNELVTNSMKYAFNGMDAGIIKVSASLKENHATVVFEDNGNGIPESIDIEKCGGFGLQLVTLLAAQLHGTIRLERQEGSRFVLEFDV